MMKNKKIAVWSSIVFFVFVNIGLITSLSRNNQVPASFGGLMLGEVAYALLSIVVAILVYRIFDKIYPESNKNIHNA